MQCLEREKQEVCWASNRLERTSVQMQKITKFFSEQKSKLHSDWRVHLRWMAGLAKPYRGKISFLFLLNIIMMVISVGTTYLTRHLIDAAVGRNGMLDGSALAAMVGFSLLNIGIGALERYMAPLLRERFSFGIRRDLYSKLLKSRWSAFFSLHSGDMVTRLSGDVDAIANGISDFLPNLFYMVARLIISFFILYSQQPVLALIVMAAGPIGFIAIVWLSAKLRTYQKELMDLESEYRGFMQETMSGITVVKAFQQEDALIGKLDAVREERYAVVRRRSQFNHRVQLVSNFVYTGGYLIAFAFGIYQITRGNMTYGGMSMALSLVSQIQGPLMSIPSMIPIAAGALASAGRTMEMVDMEQEEYIEGDALTGPVGVCFEDVRFAYEQEDVLQHVTMHVEPGGRIGLVGESGVGKTTIVRLLLSLVEPSEGHVYLRDRNGKSQRVNAGSRAYLSYVAQGNTLFSGTIRENLSMGDVQATDEQMQRALTIAEAAFVMDLPEGLDTKLTERGGTVSEGQAQRIAIARAILRKRPILILDEATSALDLKTEEAIISNLREVMEDTTLLVISHRPSLLHLCDRCYRLEAGNLRLETETIAERVG